MASLLSAMRRVVRAALMFAVPAVVLVAMVPVPAIAASGPDASNLTGYHNASGRVEQVGRRHGAKGYGQGYGRRSGYGNMYSGRAGYGHGNYNRSGYGNRSGAYGNKYGKSAYGRYRNAGYGRMAYGYRMRGGYGSSGYGNRSGAYGNKYGKSAYGSYRNAGYGRMAYGYRMRGGYGASGHSYGRGSSSGYSSSGYGRSGYSYGSGYSSTGNYATATYKAANVAQPVAQSGAPSVQRSRNDALGEFLVGPNGMTLYTFDRDTPNQSVCTGDCAQAWPPLLVAAGTTPVAADGISGTLGVITREDGGSQVTYNERPLYYYAQDQMVGDTTGNGVEGVWRVAVP